MNTAFFESVHKKFLQHEIQITKGLLEVLAEIEKNSELGEVTIDLAKIPLDPSVPNKLESWGFSVYAKGKNTSGRINTTAIDGCETLRIEWKRRR